MKKSHDHSGLLLLKFEEADYLFGLSKTMNASGPAIVDGELWRYCNETKTAWPTGWRHDGPTGTAEGVPAHAQDFDVIEKHVPSNLTFALY